MSGLFLDFTVKIKAINYLLSISITSYGIIFVTEYFNNNLKLGMSPAGENCSNADTMKTEATWCFRRWVHFSSP